MVVDRNSRGWIIVCGAALAVATAVYIPYALHRPHGPSGGSLIGLIYGIAGTAMMLFAVLLGLRKRFRTARVGRAYHWMQGHVWLGILSYPIILFHAGFRLNGSPMGAGLMVLFAIVFISGLVGLIVQQYLPGQMIREVPGETIYEQIPHLLIMLRSQAQEQMQNLRKESEGEIAELESGGVAVAASPAVGLTQLESFYERLVVPFLADPPPRRSPFSSAESTNQQFQQLARRLPVDLHEPMERLRSIVDERRQLGRQRRLYTLLHTWLLVHVPVSYGLMLLVIVHAVMAVRYGIPAH